MSFKVKLFIWHYYKVHISKVYLSVLKSVLAFYFINICKNILFCDVLDIIDFPCMDKTIKTFFKISFLLLFVTWR